MYVPDDFPRLGLQTLAFDLTQTSAPRPTPPAPLPPPPLHLIRPAGPAAHSSGHRSEPTVASRHDASLGLRPPLGSAGSTVPASLLTAFLTELEGDSTLRSSEPFGGLAPVLSDISVLVVSGAKEFRALSRALLSRTRNEDETLALVEWLVRVASDAPYVRPVLIEQLEAMVPGRFRSVPRHMLAYLRRTR